MVIPTPQAPNQKFPGPDWEHNELLSSVRNALYLLPLRFESSLRISGVLATDLFAFNTSLGATIEEQVVNSLNKLRSVWDPNKKYEHYSFERQPQTFPDVVLRTNSPDVEPKVIFGIELKGWYVLAKEEQPSFRFCVTPAVCAEADLLVVVPWALSEVVSGSPKLFSPFIVGAKYAAEYRNWHWQYNRKARNKSEQSIEISSCILQYPSKADKILDKAKGEDSNNFGRIARTGIMNSYIEKLFNERLSGISLRAWQKFLSIFTEKNTAASINLSVDKLVNGLSKGLEISSEKEDAIKEKIMEIIKIAES